MAKDLKPYYDNVKYVESMNCNLMLLKQQGVRWEPTPLCPPLTKCQPVSILMQEL